MKKLSYLVVLLSIILILFSGCSRNSIKIKESLDGEGEYWFIEYKINGKLTAKTSEFGVLRYESSGTSELILKYIKGDKLLDDINEILVKYPDDLDRIVKLSSENTVGNNINVNEIPTVSTLLALYTDDIYYITIEWKDKEKRKEIIEIR